MSLSIIERIKACGVVGAGGAGFPTHGKLGEKVDILVANGAECEPLLQSDKFIMERYPEEILQGMRYIMKEIGAKKGIIGIKEKNKLSVSKISKALEKFPDIELFKLPNYYPMGDEHVLVEHVTGRVIPEGGIPLEVGIVVNNVTTLYNVCRAVEGTPLTERVVSIVGEVKKPCCAIVPIGTPISELINFAGGVTTDDYAVLLGGPMMGNIIENLEHPISKTDGAVIILPREHTLVANKTMPLSTQIRRSKAVCCQCSYCTTLCPRNLLGHNLYPHKIMRSLSYGLDSPSGDITGASLCCHCGICGVYACVMGLEPSLINMEVKKQLAAKGWKNTVHRNKKPKPSPLSKERMVPSERLVERLGLGNYNVRVPFLGKVDPLRVNISLKQHIGAAAIPMVSEGDYVEKGQVIGEIPQDALGARVHASISGKIVGRKNSVGIEKASPK